MFQGVFKEVLCQGSFKKVSSVFHKSFEGVSRKIEGCFKRDFSGFQGYLKEFQREYQESFRCVSRVFQGTFKGISRKI